MADPWPRSSPATGHPSVCWPMLGLLLVGVAALGGVTVETSWVLAFSVLVVAALGAWRGQLRASALGWVLVALAGFTALQALPLPGALLHALAPASAAVWTKFDALAQRAGWGTVSLEPGASRLGAVRLASYAAFAFVCHGAVRRDGTRAVSAAVASTAGVLALATVGHQLTNAERVFGWYRPEYAGFVAPLMNPNALTGALSLGFFCAAGLVLDPKTRAPVRGLALGCCLVCLATALWLGSRAGVGLLSVGLVVLFGYAHRHRTAQGSGGAAWGVWALAAASVLGVVFAAFSSARLHRELFDDSLEKLTVVRPALAALRAHWLLGAGRGAFSAAVSPYVATDQGVFDHAEIFVLGWAVEWGAVALALLLIGLGLGLRPRRVLRASPTRVCAYLGVCLLWLHNLADLSLDVPFVAMAAVAATAVFCGPDVGVAARRSWAVPVLLALGVLLVSVAVWPVELARTVRHRLAAEFARGPVAISRIDAALVQHPADAYLLRVRAAAALAQRQPDTLRWVGFALQRAPASGATLLLLADTLAHRGTVAQALGVLKQVLGVNPGMVDEVARRATAWAPDDPSVIVPQGRGRLEALVALSRHARERSQALSWLARAVEQPGAPSETRIELALLALSSSDDQCQAAVDEPCARFAHEQRQQVPVSAGTRGVELDAALAWHEGKHEQAFAALQQRCPRNPSGTDCLRRLMAYGRALDVGRQVKAIDAFLSAACGSDAACASAEAEAGQALLARGERRLALVHLVHAAVLRPNEAAWRHVAELARDSDELGVLRQALSGLASLGLPVPAEFTDAVDRMQRERLLPP